MKTLKTIFKISLIISALLLTFHFVAEASNYTAPIIHKPELLPGPTADQIVQQDTRNILLGLFLPNLAIRIISLIGIAALISIIIGGIRYVTAYGSDEALEKAKTQILYSIVGFIVAILSYTIVSIVINTEFSGDNSPAPAENQPQQVNQP